MLQVTDLRKALGIPPDTRSDEEKKTCDLYINKLKEYKEHFNEDFTTEGLYMSLEEIICNIDKCIKYNRKWEGFIVPELEEDALI